MKKILLVNPQSDEAYGVAKLHNHPFIKKKAFITPLNLALLAALTPAGFQVDIWDENVQGQIDQEFVSGRGYDMAGVTGYTVHFNRVLEISRQLRAQGLLVAVGGAGVTDDPESYRDHFDVLFIGEGELIWPEFLVDWQLGEEHAEYRETGYPELSLSPPPEWGSIAHLLKDNYLLGAVQPTRGCPFQCEFCNMWKLFGNRMRVKEPLQRVVDEVRALQRYGVDEIFFTVDNFVGRPEYCKQLLRELVAMNKTFPEPVGFRAELSINIAHDPEMLELLSEANFDGVFVGLESPNLESLKETNKHHNVKYGMIESCHKIMATGIPLEGAMIVGFDHDDHDIFEQQFEFLQNAFIPNPKITILRVLPRTDLWARLLPEGRIIDMRQLNASIDDPATEYVANTIISNIVPLQMTRAELFTGYLSLLERVRDWQNFKERMFGFVANVKKVKSALLRSGQIFQEPGFSDKFIEFLPAVARSAVSELLTFTLAEQPALMKPVVISIMRNQSECVNVAQMSKKFHERIAFEEALPKGQLESFVIKG